MYFLYIFVGRIFCVTNITESFCFLFRILTFLTINDFFFTFINIYIHTSKKHFFLNNYNIVSLSEEISWVIWSNLFISWMMHVKKPRKTGISPRVMQWVNSQADTWTEFLGLMANLLLPGQPVASRWVDNWSFSVWDSLMFNITHLKFLH